jgi:hypothetical protein
MTDLLCDLSLGWHDSLCLCIPHVAQDIRQNLVGVDWAMRVVDQLAKVMVQKANPMSQAPLSSVPTRNILYGSIFVRVQYCQPDVHAQTTLAFVPNKIRQT